jgi:glucans biosynthesis protein
MLRREFLATLAALVASPTLAQTGTSGLQLGQGAPFDPSDVTALARRLSAQDYVAIPRIPQDWTEIDYEDYLSIWFDARNALWQDEEDTPLRMDMMAPGLYYPTPVDISVIENGKAFPLVFDLDVFVRTDKFPDLPIDDSLGYSGLRLRAEIEKSGIYQEFAVFQGASYFRAIGTGDIYGLSARGLAIDTAGPSGEEFPNFRAFWLEKPAAAATDFVMHALLDGPSCVGAYRFVVTPGQPLTMDVQATLFPRRAIDTVGIAPLTSMFQYDQTNRDRFSDFRPAVHDTDGLQIVNGAGETIWRPLANPKTLQISAFVDTNPRGFGLMQRARSYGDFSDLEALYHRRPGAWIEPQGDWGKGAISLIEIPTPSEIYDNIVCYWQPEGGLPAGKEARFAYRLSWGDEIGYGTGLKALNTMIGSAFNNDGIIVLIDFEDGVNVPENLSEVERLIRTTAGEISDGVLQRNPETGGPRLTFKFRPGDVELIEFRVQLRLNSEPLSEVWLYRWTP